MPRKQESVCAYEVGAGLEITQSGPHQNRVGLAQGPAYGNHSVTFAPLKISPGTAICLKFEANAVPGLWAGGKAGEF